MPVKRDDDGRRYVEAEVEVPSSPEEVWLLLERPAPGIAYIFGMPMGEMTMVSMRLFFYGAQAAGIGAEAERQWNDWLTERFPQEAPT